MINNSIINKNDYEKYRIPYVFNYFSKKRKEKNIWNELEKRHPCFSDDCCYYSKIKITKKGLFRDIFVMNKNKLAEYNSSTKKLFLGFEDNSKIKIFIGRNIKLIFVAIISLIIIFLFMINKNWIEKTRKISNENLVENKTNIAPEPKVYLSYNKNILSSFMESIKSKGAGIKYLSWKIGLNGEFLDSSVENIFPEDISDIKKSAVISTIKYMDSKPSFNYSVKNNFLLTSFYGPEENNDFNNIRSNIRDLLKKNNVEIIEELFFPYKLTFYIPFEKGMENISNFVQEMNNFIKEELVFIKTIEINRGSNGKNNEGLNVQLEFTKDKIFENSVFEIIGANIQLFVPEAEGEVERDVFENKQNININLGSLDENKKIGEVIHKSGKKTIFYKNEKGKIIMKESY